MAGHWLLDSMGNLSHHLTMPPTMVPILKKDVCNNYLVLLPTYLHSYIETYS
jgi:hypothetical protein